MSSTPTTDPAVDGAEPENAESWHQRAIQAFLGDRWWGLVVVASAITFLVTSWLQWLDYQSYYTENGDLGVYNQALFTTAKQGAFFHYTFSIPAATNGSIFAVHFSPILFLVLPFYSLAATPVTLVVIKQFVLSLGAVPLYFLARLKLGSSRWAAFIAIFYLLNPLVLLTALANFDPEVFLPVLVLSALYFGEKGRILPFLAFWLLALSTIESAGPILMVCSLTWLASTIWTMRKTRPLRRLIISLPAVASYVAAGWIGLSVLVLSFTGPRGGAFGAGYAGRFSVLGASSLPDIPLQVLTHPGSAFAALGFGLPTKVVYTVLLLAAVGFLPFLGRRRYLFPVLFWVVFIWLSNASKMYHFGLQYAAYPLPFLFAGLVTALAALGVGTPRPLPSTASPSPDSSSDATRKPIAARPLIDWRGSSRGRIASGVSGGLLVATYLVVVLLVTAAVPSNSAPSTNSPAYSIVFVPHPPSSTAGTLGQVLDLIPANGSVYTISRLYTQISSRSEAYAVSLPGELFAPPWTYSSAVGYFVNSSRYVLLDFQLDVTDSLVLGLTSNLSAFGPLAAGGGAYLLERGWSGPPAFFVAENLTYAPSQLSLKTATLVAAPGSPSGTAAYHAANAANGSTIWSGPNLNSLPPGSYRATAWILLHAPSPGPQLTLRATDTPIIANVSVAQSTSVGDRYTASIYGASTSVTLASMTLNRSASGPTTIAGNVSFDFDWPGYGYLNLKGIESSTSMSVYLYALTLTQLAP